MNRFSEAGAFAVFLLALATAWAGMEFTWVAKAAAQDTIYSGGRPMRGRVTGMTPLSLQVDVGGSSQTIHAREVTFVRIGTEGAAVERAHERLATGRFEEALAEIDRIENLPSDATGRHEIEYVRAYAAARIALAGGQMSAQDAGSRLRSFVQNYPQSYRLHPSTYLLGRLLLAINRPDLAEAEFAKLVDIDWPQYAVPARVLQGYAQLMQEKYADAQQTLAQVEQLDGSDDVTRRQRLIARSLRAQAMARQGQQDQAIALLEEMIQNRSTEDPEVLARIYNALGTSHKIAGQTRQAVIAFLHTDLLYFNDSEAHAEALYWLVDLWSELNHPDRANRARQTLMNRYRNSLWASRR